MVMKKELSTRRRGTIGILMVGLLTIGAAPACTRSQSDLPKTSTEKPTMRTQNNFYCNIKALNAMEWAQHLQLTGKLIATRREVVETDKGYEFQFDASDVSLADLARWVAAEGKCCPFFDFHIDVEREGSLLCLGLTGEDGIKPFIRTEFLVRAR